MAAQAYAYNTYAVAAKIMAGGKIGAEASLNKIFWSELDRSMHRTAMQLLGAAAELKRFDDGSVNQWLEGYIFSLSGPIYAGSNEVQRNITAERFSACRAWERADGFSFYRRSADFGRKRARLFRRHAWPRSAAASGCRRQTRSGDLARARRHGADGPAVCLRSMAGMGMGLVDGALDRDGMRARLSGRTAGRYRLCRRALAGVKGRDRRVWPTLQQGERTAPCPHSINPWVADGGGADRMSLGRSLCACFSKRISAKTIRTC